MKCPNPDHNAVPHEATAKYCHICGRPLIDDAPPAPIQQKEQARNKRNALMAGSVVVILSTLFVWLVVFSSYSSKLGKWEMIGSLICLMVVDGCIFAFLRELFNDDD